MTREDTLPLRTKLRRSNTSGYEGVSWHKSASKWGAYIRADGVRLHLGLFKTIEEAHVAHVRGFAEFRSTVQKAEPTAIRNELLYAVRQLYDLHGIKALSTPFLEKQKSRLYHRLRTAGLNQPTLLAQLGLTEEYAAWRMSARTYRGVTKPKWSWEVAVAKAREIKEREGDLPTVQWFRTNGFSSLTAAVHLSGRTWEDLREAVGCFATSNFYESRNGMRWRSRPEASLSNFLYARGIKHKRGERYAAGYSKQSGRRWGSLYQFHIRVS